MTQHPRGEMDEIPEDHCNSEASIALARPVAELWRDALTAAINSSPETSWRSVEIQLGFLTGTIAAAIDKGIMAEREANAQIAEAFGQEIVNDGTVNDDFLAGANIAIAKTVKHIAAAIRKGPTP